MSITRLKNLLNFGKCHRQQAGLHFWGIACVWDNAAGRKSLSLFQIVRLVNVDACLTAFL